ncbi:MAG TPA: nucleotide disphospho-sugar-binding domain-containing protein [Candidatus Sulfotelmatobacter sp.]|nr:nucleotide disphospho-sugar-binding domain-containing protein [Candidatus Sulfotelmatobacter sp.]
MIGKRIVFCTFGSLGDLYPMLSLAREIKRRGHSPVVATSPVYRDLVECEGVGFHPVRPDIDIKDPEILRRAMDRRNGSRYIICDLIMPFLRESYEDTAAAAADADLIVTHPITLSAFLFARKTGIPWASTALAPVSLYSIYDPPVFTGVPFAATLSSMGPFFQRLMVKLVILAFEPLWKPFRNFERELGLPKVPNPLLQGYSPHLVLGLFSPMLATPQRDWPANAHATGFPYFDHDEGNSAELQEFLDSGEPPIVFTLGSAAVGAAGDFFQQSAEAARRLRRRAVLLVGRDPRNHPKGELPAGIIAVPYAPHSAVFPRGCVVAHHGGIGTTGEAMRAGRPMLVVHYSHDQPDHAARLTRLGVARGVPRERYNTSVAAREIQALLQDQSYAQRAADLGERVRTETGTANACDLLGRLLQKADSEERIPRPADRVTG